MVVINENIWNTINNKNNNEIVQSWIVKVIMASVPVSI